jgi:homopolymeric O-antigen transport system permease protein
MAEIAGEVQSPAVVPVQPPLLARVGGAILRPLIGAERAESAVARTYALLALVYYSLRAQYARAALGLLWSVLTPLLFMAVYLPLFLYAFQAPEAVPGGPLAFPMFVIIGFIAWNAFTEAIQSGAGSLVYNTNVVRHSPTPSMMLPFVKVTTSFVGLGAGLICLSVALPAFGFWPGWSLLILPLAITLFFAFTAGLVLLISSLAMYLRDVLQILNTVLLVEFFACPILYPITMIPEKYRIYIELNPLTPFLNLVRASLFPTAVPLDIRDVGMALGWALGSLVLGFLVFRRLEPGFTDTA